MSRRDVSTTDDIWFASVLIYSGYELCSITEADFGTCIYKVQCPEMDFKQLEQDYQNNSLPLADARAFVDAFNRIVQTQESYRKRRMSGWSSQRFQDGEIG
jgi:hypothetical protein